jgi:hypothetical protein
MKKLLLSLVVVLAGCGGGSGSNTSTSQPNSPAETSGVAQQNVSIAPVELSTGPLFDTTPILLPDLKAKYDLLCGSQVNVQNAIVIDLNNDGKKDLVFNLWCKHSSEVYYGPTTNTIVALIQLSDGTFVDKTKEIFGSDIVDIGGVGSGYVTADFNGDGYNDIVFAVSHEDGRGNEGGESKNMMSQTVAFMSDGNGHYSQNRFGSIKWGDDVKLLKDTNGKNMALILPAGYSTPEVWSFNGTWNQITSYDWLQKNPVMLGSTMINKYDNGTKFEIWNLINGVWNMLSSYTFLSRTTIPIVSNGITSTANIFRVDNNDYIDYGGLYEGCSLKRTSNGPQEVIYAFLGQQILGGYHGQTIYDVYSPPTLKLISLGVTAQSTTLNPVTITTDNLDGNFYHIECVDLNGDGLDDILIRTAGNPIVYINNGNGNFEKLISNSIPVAPRGASEIYVDLDGDGVKDLLYFPIDRWQFDLGNYNKVQFKLYKGKRNVRPTEISFFSH